MRVLITLSAIVLSAVSGAQGIRETTITFADEGARVAWYASAAGEAPASAVKTLRGAINLPEGGGSNIYVLEERTGNLAIIPRASVKNDTVDVKASDFKYAYMIQVTPRTEAGDPVAAAMVELETRAGKTTALADSASGGKATFFGVPFGDARITVVRNESGGDEKRIEKAIAVGPKRTDEENTFIITVPGAKAAEAGSAAAEGGAKPPAGEAKGGSEAASKDEPAAARPGFGTLLSYLLSFGAIAALAYFALRYYRQNPDSVNAKLEQLGVQVPKPADAASSAPPPNPNGGMPPKPDPIKPIVLDPAAAVTSAVPATPMVIPAPTGELRLVATGRFQFPLTDGEYVVGRDDTADITLAGETTVSRRHARVIRRGSTVSVEDLGSTNGTFVNGMRLTNSVELRAGDRVQFGEVALRFES